MTPTERFQYGDKVRTKSDDDPSHSGMVAKVNDDGTLEIVWADVSKMEPISSTVVKPDDIIKIA